jgi:hypothetical protein
MIDVSFLKSYIATDAELESLIGVDKRASAIELKNASATDQEWYCQQATEHIDQLPLGGRRYEEPYIENGIQKDSNGDGLAQVLEFPRIIDGEICDYDHGTQLPTVPVIVKRACMEEAIAICAAGTDGGLKTLQENGVTSMSIGGKLSYTFTAGAGSASLLSAASRRLLRRYMGSELK